jgi:ATP-binding cassette subfamily A (ABC1) protein 3
MKREMWTTLRSVSAGKAVVITTRLYSPLCSFASTDIRTDSMEEASALSNKVAILAKKMLAVGTTAELEARYARYEVHFACRTPAEVLRAREAMARVPGARAADDVATRFEVPIVRAGAEDGCTLADLFGVLAAQEGLEYTVERPTLESVFLKVIREHNVEEEDDERRKVGMWTLLRRML